MLPHAESGETQGVERDKGIRRIGMVHYADGNTRTHQRGICAEQEEAHHSVAHISHRRQYQRAPSRGLQAMESVMIVAVGNHHRAAISPQIGTRAGGHLKGVAIRHRLLGSMGVQAYRHPSPVGGSAGRTLAGPVGGSSGATATECGECQAVGRAHIEPPKRDGRLTKGIRPDNTASANLANQAEAVLCRPTHGDSRTVDIAHPQVLRHTGLQAEVFNKHPRLATRGTPEHYGGMACAGGETRHVVHPAVGSREMQGVGGHECRSVGGVGNGTHQQHGILMVRGGVGPESKGHMLRTGLHIGKYGHRAAAAEDRHTQRTAARTVTVAAHQRVLAVIRQAPPVGRIAARRQAVEVLAVGQLYGRRHSGEILREVMTAAIGGAVVRAHMQTISGVRRQARKGYRTVGNNDGAAAGNKVYALHRSIFYPHSVAAHQHPAHLRRMLLYGAHRHRLHHTGTQRHSVDCPHRRGTPQRQTAVGPTGHPDDIPRPAAVARKGVGGHKRRVGCGHTSHHYVCIAKAVEFQVEGVGRVVAEQGHHSRPSCRYPQGSRALVGGFRERRTVADDPSLRQFPFLKARAVGRRHLVGESVEPMLVEGRRLVAARGRYIEVVVLVVGQTVEREGLPLRDNYRPAARFKPRRPVFYLHNRTLRHHHSVPRQRHAALGQVVHPHIVYHASGYPQLVDGQRPAAYGTQGQILPVAGISSQRNHLPPGSRLKSVYRHEALGLVGILHSAHHEPHIAAPRNGKRHIQIAEHSSRGQRQHSYATVTRRRRHAQHSARHLRLVGHRAAPVARHYAVHSVEVLVVGYRHARTLQCVHSHRLSLRTGTAHLEHIVAVGRKTRDGQRTRGGTYHRVAPPHLYGAYAVGLEIERHSGVAHVVRPRRRGAAAAHRDIVYPAGIVVCLQGPLHAERQPPPHPAVGTQVYHHLLPAAALIHMQCVERHKGATVAVGVLTDTHLQPRRCGEREKPETEVQPLERRHSVDLGRDNHAVVALGQSAGIEHHRCNSAVVTAAVEVRGIAYVVVSRDKPARGHQLGTRAVAVKLLVHRHRQHAVLLLGRYGQCRQNGKHSYEHIFAHRTY